MFFEYDQKWGWAPLFTVKKLYKNILKMSEDMFLEYEQKEG